MVQDEQERRGAPPGISRAEWEIMKVLWSGGPMAARDVCATLPSGHGWADKTVKTLLSRLVAKGAVAYEQVGNSYLYRAAVDRHEVTHEEVRGFVERVLDGAALPLVAHFIERHDLTPGEIESLRGILERKRQGRGRKRGKGAQP